MLDEELSPRTDKEREEAITKNRAEEDLIDRAVEEALGDNTDEDVSGEALTGKMMKRKSVVTRC